MITQPISTQITTPLWDKYENFPAMLFRSGRSSSSAGIFLKDQTKFPIHNVPSDVDKIISFGTNSEKTRFQSSLPSAQPHPTNSKLVDDPYAESVTQFLIQLRISSFIPPEVASEFQELCALKDGWDEGNEIAPKKPVLDTVFNLIVDLAEQSIKEGYSSVWPQLGPGFRGEVGIEYVQGNQELCIEVSPTPRIPTTWGFVVTMDDRGKIIRTDRVNSDELTDAFVRFLHHRAI
jgi:hypothetical protein